MPDNKEEWIDLIKSCVAKHQSANNDKDHLTNVETLALALRITTQLTAAEKYQLEAVSLSTKPIKKIQNLTRLAIIYQWQERFNEAQKIYDEVRELIENNEVSEILLAAYHQHLGKLYFDQKKYDLSVKEFKKSFEIRTHTNAPIDQIESSRLALKMARSKITITYKNKFIIRYAVSTDIERIAFINSESWKTTYKGIVSDKFLETLSTETQIPRAKRLVESSEVKAFVAIEVATNTVVGFACIGKNREPKINADCELQAIYLLQEHQGFGAGKALFEFGIEELKRQTKKTMMVSVFEANKRARHFYELQGGMPTLGDHVELDGAKYPTSTYLWDLRS